MALKSFRFLQTSHAYEMTETMLSIKQTTGIQNLDENHYFSNFVPSPSLNTQKFIVKYIIEKNKIINSVIKNFQKEISLIQEYRDRLIADVVTGKVDVRKIKVPNISPIGRLAVCLLRRL